MEQNGSWSVQYTDANWETRYKFCTMLIIIEPHIQTVYDGNKMYLVYQV